MRKMRWVGVLNRKSAGFIETIMSLIQWAKLNGLDPYRYLKDVLERIPTQPASRLGELLPHRWQPSLIH
jgi:transposase